MPTMLISPSLREQRQLSGRANAAKAAAMAAAVELAFKPAAAAPPPPKLVRVAKRKAAAAAEEPAKGGAVTRAAMAMAKAGAKAEAGAEVEPEVLQVGATLVVPARIFGQRGGAYAARVAGLTCSKGGKGGKATLYFPSDQTTFWFPLAEARQWLTGK